MNFFGKKNESRINDKIKKPIVHLDLKIHHEFFTFDVLDLKPFSNKVEKIQISLVKLEYS